MRFFVIFNTFCAIKDQLRAASTPRSAGMVLPKKAENALGVLCPLYLIMLWQQIICCNE